MPTYTTETKLKTFNPNARADAERYRRYAAAKARIPMNISALEYEAAVRRLARKYKI